MDEDEEDEEDEAEEEGKYRRLIITYVQ